jgi:hypothetical protein
MVGLSGDSRFFFRAPSLGEVEDGCSTDRQNLDPNRSIVDSTEAVRTFGRLLLSASLIAFLPIPGSCIHAIRNK